MKKATVILGILWVVMTSGIALSDNDHLESRRLMEQGKILPLQKILDLLGPIQRRRVLEVNLEHEGGRYIYEIELLGNEGRVWEYKLDASTGEILDQEEED